jgi:hypothetical protein
LFIQRTSDAGYHEEFDPVNNGMTIGGLIMDSGGDGIDMNTTKVFALGAGDTAGDAVGWGQAGVQLGDTLFTDDVDMGHNVITNLNGPPVNPEDAANKAYVDAIAQGLDVHTGVWAKLDDLTSWTSTGTGPTHVLTAPTNALSWNTIDGHLFAGTGAAQRVLVDDGTANPDNGVYYVSQLGNAGANSFKLTRAADADQAIALELARGLYVFVNDGTVYENTGWFEMLEVTTIESDDVEFAQFSGAPGLTFDQGLIRSLASVKVDLHTAANTTGAGAAGGSSGLEFNVNTVSGMLRAAVQTLGAIERGQGVAATGSITAKTGALTNDGDTFTIGDGVNSVTFEFDNNASAPPNPVTFVGTENAAAMAALIQTAINAVTTGLLVTAAAPSGAVVGLTNDGVGTAGNVTVTQTGTSITPAGMLGGENAGLRARVDGTTITIDPATNNLVAASATSAEEAKRVENTYAISAVNLAIGDPVYVSAANTVSLADTDTDVKSRVLGVSRLAVTAPASVEVVTAGVVTAVWAGTGASGSPYYLANGGGLSVSLPAGAKRVIQVGVAKNTNDLHVRLYDFGKKAA